MRLPPLLSAAALAAVAVAVAACEPAGEAPAGEDRAAAAPAPAAPSLTLGGVDLEGEVNLLGTEPFWGVDIRGERIRLAGVDRSDVFAPNPGPRVQGTVAVWETQTENGLPMELMVIETACSDGMSDRTYPLTARVRIGAETLTGCGASADFILNTDERGEPRA